MLNVRSLPFVNYKVQAIAWQYCKGSPFFVNRIVCLRINSILIVNIDIIEIGTKFETTNIIKVDVNNNEASA